MFILLMSLMTIGWGLMYFVIKAYYRSNNIRFPYEKWYLSWKKDVTIREKLILSALMQVPFAIMLMMFRPLYDVLHDFMILIESIIV